MLCFPWMTFTNHIPFSMTDRYMMFRSVTNLFMVTHKRQFLSEPKRHIFLLKLYVKAQKYIWHQMIYSDISYIPFITKMIFVIWIYLILDTSYILKGRSQELLQIDFYHLMLERVTLGIIVFMYAHIPIRKRIKSSSSIMGMSKWKDNVQNSF